MTNYGDLAILDLPPQLDVVGRIRPEQVWDYVNQTRKLGASCTRDIAVVRFSTPPGAESQDREAFSTHLRSLHKSARFSVVGNHSKLVKDFYIVPLPKDSPVPVALMAMSLGQLALGETRSHMLLGVLVLLRKKRPSTSRDTTKPAKVAKTAALAKGPSPGTTPPGTSSPGGVYIPTARRPSKESSAAVKPNPTKPSGSIEEAPYSPGQLLDDDDDGGGPTSEILKQKEMLEELNRKIEKEKQIVAVMSAEVASTSPVAETNAIPGLGEPVIPGLGGFSSGGPSWTKETRSTPSSDPPFEHATTAPPASSLNLNLSNLQVKNKTKNVFHWCGF